MCSCHSILECCVTLSGVKLSIRSFVLFRIGERTNLVNVGNHFSYVFHLLHSQRSGNFVSGSDIDSRENVLVLIPIQHIAGQVQQIELMHFIGNHHFVMMSVDML